MGPASTLLLEVLERSQSAGFLGPGPIERHVEHAGAFAGATPPPELFLDLGSGGGVPGLVLATLWPHALGTLLDTQLRRVRFLTEAIEVLGISERVTAVHARAEELAHDPTHRGRYDVVTARSFSPPALTAECAAGFLRMDGVLLVAEPPTAPDERWPEAGLQRLGLVDDGVVTAKAGKVRLVRSIAGPPEGLPRRTAALVKRPRF